MPTIYTIHEADAAKLETVKAEMQTLGAPTIRVVDCGDYYMALEGCHRVAAAHALGVFPKLIIYAQDDEIEITEYDWYTAGVAHNWAGTVYPAGEVAGELFSVRAPVYMF